MLPPLLPLPNVLIVRLIAFAASVWINDVFIDTVGALTPQGDANALFPFPEGSVIPGKDNVLTVLMDHMGNDEGQNREYYCDVSLDV